MNTAELMSAVNFVEYAESCGLELEYKNGEYWGLSPFKEEKTPSFSINEEKQNFYDFSSGKGGNLLSFIMELRHCELKDAVKELMNYAGITDDSKVWYSNTPEMVKIARKYKPSNHTKPVEGEYEKLPDTYMDIYEDDKSKLQIWRDEGMSDEILERYQVRYDPFANRIVQPIRDYDGNIVNICGRTLEKDFKEKGLRKYTYYKKWGKGMNVLFGYSENLPEIRRKNEVILFEGAKSVMIAETWGYKNCCAVLTSHLSEGQFRQLIKLGANVVFALDEEVDPRVDKNIQRLSRYCRVYYIKDTEHLLESKMAPVDAGREVWQKLYERRRELSSTFTYTRNSR